MSSKISQRDLLASAAVLLSGASWGLFWLPARWLSARGLDSVWLAIWLFLISLAMFVPTTYFLLWSTQILNPGRVGILLMSEVVVGSVSAALLSGEPFGWREAIGALLIVGAGFIEVTGSARDTPVAYDRVV